MPPRRLALSLLLAGAACSLVACSSSEPASDTVSLSFQARFSDREVTDLGEEGSSIGDYVDGNGVLLDSAGAVIGNFDVSSWTTGSSTGTETRMLMAEYEFGTGADSFMIQGAEPFLIDGGLPAVDRPSTYAVIGGTGTYMGADGECLVHRREDAFEVDCTFIVPAS